MWHTSFDTGTCYSSQTILYCVTHQLRHWYRLFFSDYLILCDTLASTLVPVILLILSYIVWHTSFDTGTGYSSQTILSCMTHQLRHWYQLFFSDSYIVWHTSFDTGTGYSSQTLILYDTLASTAVPVILLRLSYLVWHTLFDTGTGYSSQLSGGIIT